jgi:methionine aminopeptidase
MKAGCLQTFPGLRESKGVMVTQVEKTVLILENETILLGE